MLKDIPIYQISKQPDTKARLSDVPSSYTKQCLNDLAILEPSFCRKKDDSPDRYELVSEARPWLAAQICQFETIPVFVLANDYDNYQPYVTGTTMNPIEVAELNHKLKLEQGLSVSALARKLGINRSALAHSLRLLNLVEPIKEKVREGVVTAGFARRFAAFNDETQAKLFSHFMKSNPRMSIRALEEALRNYKSGKLTSSIPKKDPSLIRLERLMTEQIGSRVELHQNHITIDFGGNLEVFDGILTKFGIQSSSL